MVEVLQCNFCVYVELIIDDDDCSFDAGDGVVVALIDEVDEGAEVGKEFSFSHAK
jgi:hypothetical protein